MSNEFENDVIYVPKDKIEVMPGTTRRIDSGALMQLLQNPQQIRNMFGLDDEQADNVIALATGAGTAAAVKYLGKAIGPVAAALLGAGLASWSSQKLLKGR